MTREREAGLLPSEPDPLTKGQRPRPCAKIVPNLAYKVKDYVEIIGFDTVKQGTSNKWVNYLYKKSPSIALGVLFALIELISLPFWRQRQLEQRPILPMAHDMASKTRRSSIDSNT